MELCPCAAARVAGKMWNSSSTRHNVRGQRQRVKPKPGWGGQPWFYLRLVAYSFLGLSEGA